MAITTAEARQELLEGLAEAIDAIGLSLAELGAAYELLDERSGDRLEEELFGPVQLAYGRAKTAYSAFAGSERAFEMPAPSAPSTGARGLIDSAVEAIERGDAALSDLQDSQYWTEAGDANLRAGVTGARQLLGELPRKARELERTLGR